MSGRTSLILAVIVLAAVLAIAGLNQAWAQVAGNAGSDLANQTLSQVLIGNYRVFGVDISANGPLDQVRRIELHEQYVVLIDYTGAGRVIPISQIKHLRWERI
jgi:hypothetical protein